VLDRAFEAPAPNRKWIADFTYIWTAEGWLYVAAVLDLLSRRLVDERDHDGSARRRRFRHGDWRRGRPEALCIIRIAAARADSSGRRNEFFVGRSQKFVKCLCGRSPFERLARSCVEGGRHGGDLVSTMHAQVCALWKILT